MSSELFTPVLVEDDRLILSSKLPYEIYQGASSVSPQVFSANTSTASSHTYTITVPSYETVTDMNVMFDGDIIYTITGTPAAGEYLVNLGNTGIANIDCLAAFPFLQNIIVASATVNQSQVSLNVQDVLPALLPCIARESLSTWNSMTPTMLDNTQSYTQAGYTASQASVFAPYLSSNNYKDTARGAWKVKSITGNSAGGGAKVVVVTFHVTEPIGVLSPFLFAKPGAGVSGVQAINLNLTLDSAATRSWRSTSTLQTVSCAYANCQMLVNFLSPKASQLVKYSPRNILPFSQLQVYKSNAVTAASLRVNSPSIQLSSIPKMALIYVRPVVRTSQTPDFVLPIQSININWNGRNGLLSGATPQQLYAMSVQSGLNMNWQEWSGSANGYCVAGVPTAFFTQGGPLCLTFGKDIECSNEYDAPGSIGQFNMAVNVVFTNDCGFVGNVELYMVLVNEGLFESSRGSSSSYTSIVSKSDCLSVLSDAAISDTPAAQTLPIEGSEALTGGRRRVGKGRSGGAPSYGSMAVATKMANKLTSRLV